MALKRCLFEYTESEKWKKRYVKKNKNERKSQNCEILSQSNGILFIQFFFVDSIHVCLIWILNNDDSFFCLFSVLVFSIF